MIITRGGQRFVIGATRSYVAVHWIGERAAVPVFLKLRRNVLVDRRAELLGVKR